MTSAGANNTADQIQTGSWPPIWLAAPHRVLFLLGALQLVATMVVWLVIMSGWYLPAVPVFRPTIASPHAHAFLMLYGVFTFFVFGFILTVFPRWLGTPRVAPSRYARIALLMTLGVLGVYAGLGVARWLAAVGCLIFVAGWALGIWTLIRIWRDSPRAATIFPLLPLSCITAGALGAALFGVWLATGVAGLVGPALTAGLWLYLVPLVTVIGQRMIPFFTVGALSDYTMVRPFWLLPPMLACAAGHFALTVAGLPGWTVVADLPLAAIAAWHTWQWGLVRSLRVPLVGMLHVSFAWLGIGSGLFGLRSVLLWFDSPVYFGAAPLHALAIGLVTSMVVAMATRVSMGHSGRPLVAGRVGVWAFGVVQLTAVLRVVAELSSTTSLQHWLMPAAAVLWLVAFVPWSLRFGAIYLRPRVDGAPG
ncbi:NnrS family protein [Salinisphaera orenii]|uniref:NnrS family protein n=1 Tax=Salinisphaera orenii TaxID=856731 RepID=UPI000DBE8348